MVHIEVFGQLERNYELFHAAQNTRYSGEFLRNLFQNVQEHFGSFGIFSLPDNFGQVIWVEKTLFWSKIW
jgi:hypothetical protein